MGNLKYRIRMMVSVNKGLHKEFYNYSIDSDIPLSRLADEAIEDFLDKHRISYEKIEGYKKRKK